MADSSGKLTLQTYPSLITTYNAQFDTKKTGFIEFDEFILVWIFIRETYSFQTSSGICSMFNGYEVYLYL